jgi:hypothetical protein
MERYCACRRHLRCPLQERGPRHVPLEGRLAGKLHQSDASAEGQGATAMAFSIDARPSPAFGGELRLLHLTQRR